MIEQKVQKMKFPQIIMCILKKRAPIKIQLNR